MTFNTTVFIKYLTTWQEQCLSYYAQSLLPVHATVHI